MAAFASRLVLLLQRVLPKRSLTAIFHYLARIRVAAIKNLLIRSFLKIYSIDLDDISKSVPDDFSSFNDFFIRELRRDARPIDSSDSSIVSPADGFISAVGSIERNLLLQAKRLDYSLEDLLASDLDDAERYVDGSFATIYLAPFNYHRVHAPLAAELVAARFVPGTLFSVSPLTVSNLRGLFVRNERLICHFSSAAGPYVVIFVGAMNVGSISTPWTGEIRPRGGAVVDNIDLQESTTPRAIDKGGLLGWFNMGSTVILLMAPGVCKWRSDLATGEAVRMGEAIGQLTV